MATIIVSKNYKYVGHVVYNRGHIHSYDLKEDAEDIMECIEDAIGDGALGGTVILESGTYHWEEREEE